MKRRRFRRFNPMTAQKEPFRHFPRNFFSLLKQFFDRTFFTVKAEAFVWRLLMTNARYRWVIVAAGGLLGCVAIGAMFSLPVFLLPIARDTGWSVTGVSAAMTIGFLAMSLSSLVWGALSDRLGPRFVALTGSIILAASLALASRATSLIQFQLIF